jgi:two-component system sensor histidine kinase EvgS
MSLPLALIIEDDTKLAHIFAEALRAAKFETEIIKDGHTALDRIAVTTPAVVVLDLHLPEVSGETILHQIRADERLTGTNIIIATADPHLAEILRSQADLVLIKPISFGQLRDLAKRLRPIDQL